MAVLTYETSTEADADKAHQASLLRALTAWGRALRRDECGAWAIIGTRGRIYTQGDGATWVAFVQCRSPQHWTFTKRRLEFCTITQDGDDEGCIRLHALPTPEQADELREVFGIRKRRELSEEERDRLKGLGFKRGAHCEARVCENIGLGPNGDRVMAQTCLHSRDEA